MVSLNIFISVLCVSADSCMPLNFTSHVSHGDYKVRGATLPRMGSGEARGRRGSTGTHRVKEGVLEQKESQDKRKTPLGGKGSSNSRQHSGNGWIIRLVQAVKCFLFSVNLTKMFFLCLFRVWGRSSIQPSLFPTRSSSEGA